MDVPIDRSRLLKLLERLLTAHAPPGAEGEVDAIVMDEVRPLSASVWQDPAESIVIHFRGRGDGAPVAVTAHKDEISLMVKRVQEDGRLRVRPLGGLHAWAAGEGPVDVLTECEPLTGILSVGSKHVSDESPAGRLKTGKAVEWEAFWIETKRSAAELQDLGVHRGSKAVLARSRKPPVFMGDFICGYNLDCRAGLAVLIEAARQLAETPPPHDVYLIASSEEEIGAQGAAFSIGQLPAQTAIALRHLESLATGMGFETQPAVVTSYGSDASIAKRIGSAGRSACIAYPGENTHGYEICSMEGIVNSARLLMAYLRNPQD